MCHAYTIYRRYFLLVMEANDWVQVEAQKRGCKRSTKRAEGLQNSRFGRLGHCVCRQVNEKQ